MKKAVFLDRDGTINRDPGYIGRPKDMELYERAPDALKLLREYGYEIVIVTNQSGIGRGIFGVEDLVSVHEKMNELIEKAGGPRIEHIYYCPHRPDEGCSCRKPGVKLLTDARDALDIDLSGSFMVGDKVKDLQAGKRAGCRASVLVRTGGGRKSELELKGNDADFVGDDLLEAAEWICGKS